MTQEAIKHVDVSLDQQFMEAAFEAVLLADAEISEAKARLAEATINLNSALNAAENKQKAAWLEVEKLMSASGEYEVTLPGEGGVDYKINYSTPRQSVKIVDPEAVPDEFCKIERKPKLKEIGDMLKAGLQTNYATLEYGERRLQWKAVKKTTTKEKE